MTINRSSWQITGAAILPELIELLDISAAECQLLKELQPQAVAQSPAMIEAFYQRLFSHEQTAEYLQGAPIDRLHSMLGDWFTELFSGNYGENYVQKRLGIGHIHVRIGLPVRYPLAMLDVISAHGEAVTRQSAQPAQAQLAFHKLLALDVAIFNQAYEDNQLEHLAGLVGGTRLARLLLSGRA